MRLGREDSREPLSENLILHISGNAGGPSSVSLGTTTSDLPRLVTGPSLTHLVLIPSFNSGELLIKTVRVARAHWSPVWIVIDGSTDGSEIQVAALASGDPDTRLLRLPTNMGKGAAVRFGLTVAYKEGFTHALLMDADDQHPAERIGTFMEVSMLKPKALIAGQPQFGTDAPWIRVYWRRLSNAAARMLTGRHVGDTLYGFRVYPVETLLSVLDQSTGMNGFDFDSEALIRLVWRGLPLVRLPALVTYRSRSKGGISHFKYLRDNLLLARMYCRLSWLLLRSRAGRKHKPPDDE